MIPHLKGIFANWLANAAAGESVIVQTAHHNRNPDVANARNAGLITTAQKRAEGHAFHLIATRLSRPPKQDKAPLGRGQIAHLDSDRRKGKRPATLAKMREAIRLHAMGMTYAEIGPRLGVSPKTVKDYMHDARAEGMI